MAEPLPPQVTSTEVLDDDSLTSKICSDYCPPPTSAAPDSGFDRLTAQLQRLEIKLDSVSGDQFLRDVVADRNREILELRELLAGCRQELKNKEAENIELKHEVWSWKDAMSEQLERLTSLHTKLVQTRSALAETEHRLASERFRNYCLKQRLEGVSLQD